MRVFSARGAYDRKTPQFGSSFRAFRKFHRAATIAATLDEPNPRQILRIDDPDRPVLRVDYHEVVHAVRLQHVQRFRREAVAAHGDGDRVSTVPTSTSPIAGFVW